MIQGLVDYALGNRFVVTAFPILLFVWGYIAFRGLPIDAYPDAANNHV